MDIKIKGISEEIMHTAINQANEGRQFILSKMLECVPEVASELSVYAPKIVSFEINPEKIGDVIGKQGCVIKKIMEETDTQIEFNDDDSGRGYISCVGPIENAERAKAIVMSIAREPSGRRYVYRYGSQNYTFCARLLSSHPARTAVFTFPSFPTSVLKRLRTS